MWDGGICATCPVMSGVIPYLSGLDPEYFHRKVHCCESTSPYDLVGLLISSSQGVAPATQALCALGSNNYSLRPGSCSGKFKNREQSSMKGRNLFQTAMSLPCRIPTGALQSPWSEVLHTRRCSSITPAGSHSSGHRNACAQPQAEQAFLALDATENWQPSE